MSITATANGAGYVDCGTGTFANASMASTTYTPTTAEIGTTVSLTWTTADPDGARPCTSASDMVDITINTPATANAGAYQTVCGNARCRLRLPLTAQVCGRAERARLPMPTWPAQLIRLQWLKLVPPSPSLGRRQTPMAQALYQCIGYG
ncbi:MAG: hypothetical protein R2795_18525 [Saprospiraceae bacterium]